MSFKAAHEMSDLSESNHDQALPTTDDKLNTEPHSPRSLIGENVYFEGEITSREDMLIDGRVDGTIALKANALEIGVGGRIRANVFAKLIVVSGELIGDIYASDQVVVTKTGKITGDIYTADVSIEDGAHIKGNIDMQKQDIFKQQAMSESTDEAHSKGAGFGSFLFNKKARDLVQSDVSAIHDIHESNINVAEELAPLSTETAVNLENHDAAQSSIGESIMLKGKLISEEDLVMHGHFDGIIYFKNNSLGVGPHSQIKARVIVKSLVSHGEIRGDIFASSQVMIKKPGHVQGNIYSPRVSTEKGAVLKGSISMEPQDIEKVFASFEGTTGTIDKTPHQQKAEVRANANDDEEGEAGSSGQRGSMQHKDSAWPIFYPRT